MKIIDHKKLDTLSIHKKIVLEGYDVYLAAGFWDINGNLRNDCPIFIEKGNKDYYVVTAEDINNWKNETIIFIKQNLPKIEDPICRYVSPAQIGKNALPFFIMELSREVYDREGNVVADVIAFKRKPSDDMINRLEDSEINIPSVEIMVNDCQNRFFLKGVIDVILNSSNSVNYRGISMWYKPEKEDYTTELGFLKTEAGISYKTIE